MKYIAKQSTQPWIESCLFKRFVTNRTFLHYECDRQSDELTNDFTMWCLILTGFVIFEIVILYFCPTKICYFAGGSVMHCVLLLSTSTLKCVNESLPAQLLYSFCYLTDIDDTRFRFLWPCIVSKVWRERKLTRCNNQMFIINFCLNVFRAPLCPSSGEQRPCYCM